MTLEDMLQVFTLGACSGVVLKLMSDLLLHAVNALFGLIRNIIS